MTTTKLVFNEALAEKVLKVAAIIHLLLGAMITFSPHFFLKMFGPSVAVSFASEQGTMFFHFYGMALGVLGVGFGLASQGAYKNWQFVLTGFLFHLMGAYVFVKGLVLGEVSAIFLGSFLAFSLLWPVLFYFLLISAFNFLTLEEEVEEEGPHSSFQTLLNYVKTSQDIKLADLSKEQGVMLIFTRQFGCTFCREMLSDLKRIDEAAKKKNLHLVFVHMSDREYANEFFSKYYETPIHHISDPGRKLYKSLNLKRGAFSQLFGLRVFLRGIYSILIKNNLPGEAEGDGLQLGGLFIVKNKVIVFEDKAKSAAYKFNLETLPEF